MSSAVASERTHCRVGPRLAHMDATVVPQEPPPRTTTLGSRCEAAMRIRVLPTTAVAPAVGELSRHRLDLPCPRRMATPLTSPCAKACTEVMGWTELAGRDEQI